MTIKHLVVHIGAPKTASTAIQRGLFANQDLLEGHGIYLPRSGRLELEPRAVAHHHLGWELFSPERFNPRQGGWQALAEEVHEVEASTVLLSSEELSRLIWSGKRHLLEERLLALSENVTVVLCVRDQLSMLNSYYAQRVKMLKVLPEFHEFAEDFAATQKLDFDASFHHWYGSGPLRLTAIPFGIPDAPAPLAGVLDAAGVPVPAGLDTDPGTVNPSLGTVGIEAARFLARYLHGRFPDFRFSSPSGRRLHRIAGKAAFEHGWCEDRFWGWTPSQATTIAAAFADSNDRFSRAMWGTTWPVPLPTDRSERSVVLEDLPPPLVEQIHQHVFTMADRYRTLVSREGSA